MVSISEYDYELPGDLIAQTPIEPRDVARLLVATDGTVSHKTVRDLPALLQPGDLVVLNETKVIPARFNLHKATGGAAEVLLLECETGDRWNALVRPSRKLPQGTELFDRDGNHVVTVGDHLGDTGMRQVFMHVSGFGSGEMPLPPYIHARLADPSRYQTVYANREGSAAAPTAGLHLTDELLSACVARGIEVAKLDLQVGLDTFRPITEDNPENHEMHSERYAVAPEVMSKCRNANRVVAIGTTTTRALESAAATGQLEGRTDIFIRPGFEFQVVDVLMTNFHLPRTTLLLMIAAFYGPEWREIYMEAIEQRYRFLSFGDAMLLDRA